MKKIIALLLAVVLCFALVACGGDNGNNKTQSVDEAELLGEWYDLKTANRLVVSGDNTVEYYVNNLYPNPGGWKLNGDVFDENCHGINSDLSVEYDKGTLCMKNDECTFMRWEDIKKDKLDVGESGGKENVILTLNDFEFTTEAPDSLLNSVWDDDIEEFAPEDGMTYAKVSVNVANMSKQEINVPDTNLDLDLILNYNNGFIYSTHDNQKSYFATENDYVIHDGIGGQTGEDIQIQPLQAKTIDVYIPCPELIEKDKDAPLSVGIISHYDTEIYYCEYSIR